MNYKHFLTLFVLFIFIFLPKYECQKNELTPYQEYLIQLKEFRRNCRNALKPYRYDGSLTTHFSYKEYTYAKEVEIATIQNEVYSFITECVNFKKINKYQFLFSHRELLLSLRGPPIFNFL